MQGEGEVIDVTVQFTDNKITYIKYTGIYGAETISDIYVFGTASPIILPKVDDENLEPEEFVPVA